MMTTILRNRFRTFVVSYYCSDFVDLARFAESASRPFYNCSNFLTFRSYSRSPFLRSGAHEKNSNNLNHHLAMQQSSISNVSNVTNVIGRVGEGELDNGDIYQTNNYVAKNKLNRANIDKFNKYYNNISDDESMFSILGNDLENINLLRRRLNSNNFMPDYKLVKSFDDINFTEDDFIINFYNYINKDKYNLKKINYDYKNEFNIILRNLIKGKVYKIIFR